MTDIFSIIADSEVKGEKLFKDYDEDKLNKTPGFLQSTFLFPELSLESYVNMEVDVEGNLANWMIPGKKVTGMGGAMDLVHGAKTIIVMMTHFNKNGSPKMLKRCGLPLTGLNVVDLVVTDRGLFSIKENRFNVMELAPDVSKESLGISEELLSEGH